MNREEGPLHAAAVAHSFFLWFVHLREESHLTEPCTIWLTFSLSLLEFVRLIDHTRDDGADRFVCARQLKTVRRQFNEYDAMKRTLLYMTITLLSYAVVVVFWLADDLVMQRRVAMFCESLFPAPFLHGIVSRLSPG